MRKTRLTPLGANSFAVRVDSYSDGVMKGAFNGPNLPAPIDFNSLVGLIIMIDGLLDEHEDMGELPQRPEAQTSAFTPTFELEVLFRQNQSWQGRITFVEEEREATFRSVLELLIIIQTVLGE